ncbi:MAG: hypothetical protein LUE31_04555, partial [Lachnospiraceae bacterium]|nr:hypothetical protein [Lachnospiraceae bacterium]
VYQKAGEIQNYSGLSGLGYNKFRGALFVVGHKEPRGVNTLPGALIFLSRSDKKLLLKHFFRAKATTSQAKMRYSVFDSFSSVSRP